MKKVIFYLFLIISCPILLFSQKNGYKISVKIENTKDTMLILGNYYGNIQQARDTTYINKKGIFLFENKERNLQPGIYFVVTSSGRYFEFIVNTEPQHFSLETNDSHYIRNMNVRNSEENRLFYEFSKLNLKTFEQVESLKKNPNRLDSLTLLEEQKKLVRQLDSFKIQYIKDNPNHMLSRVFNATKDIDIPDAPIDEQGTADPYFQYLYYREHYFDNIDLGYDGMIRTPSAVFYDRFTNYFDNVLKNQPSDTIIKYADMVIGKAEPSEEMFKFIVWYLADKYLKSPVMGYDAIYVHIIQKYYVSGKAFWASPSDIEEEGRRAAQWEKLLIGKPAQELVTLDTNGNWISLYDIPAKFTMLIFWSPDCGHCATEIPELHEFYLKNKDKYSLEIYAINTDISEEEKWKEFVRKHKLSWINTNGRTANIDWKDAYDIYKTPILYLFNKDKIMIGKHFNVKTLEEILIHETEDNQKK